MPIHQEIVFNTTPSRLYQLLTDAEEFSKHTDGTAEIDANAGGSFALFGGMIEGRNVECVPNQRLVQAWRVKHWEAGLYSMVRFELRAEGKSTRVVLDHSSYPAADESHLDQGWHANYWERFKRAL